MQRALPRSTLFPYTTLFRSGFETCSSFAVWVLERRFRCPAETRQPVSRSEEHTSELQSRLHLVCRLLLEKKKRFSAFLHAVQRRTDVVRDPACLPDPVASLR